MISPKHLLYTFYLLPTALFLLCGHYFDPSDFATTPQTMRYMIMAFLLSPTFSAVVECIAIHFFRIGYAMNLCK